MRFQASTSNLWYGTDESYIVLLDAVEQVQALQLAGEDALKTAIKMRGGGSATDPFALPPLWEAQGGVAVVHISGSLISGSAGFMRLFGALGYEDIANALMEAAASKDVKQIILNIDSGGGSVNGLEEAGNLIQQVDKIKPVVAFTDGGMLSAAYWLGASARQVFGSKTSQTGSVGTLIVHTEYSKQLADAGIKKTVVKYGKYKAFGNPFEPLSDEAKAQIQALADEAGKIFVDYVAGRRGVSAEKFQSTMGEGRVFMGRLANEVGLIDGVKSLAEVGTFAKSLDKPNPTPHNPRNSSKDSAMKLSKKILLLIAQGAKLDTLALSAVDANVDGAQLDAAGIEALKAEASELIAARDTTVTAAAGTAVTEVTSQLNTAKAELQAAKDKVALLEAGSNALTGKVDAATNLAASYAGIVKLSMSTMSVALGGSKDVGASLTGEALLAEHKRLEEEFTKKFPGGAVAAVNPGMKTEADKVSTPPPAFLALVKQTAA